MSTVMRGGTRATSTVAALLLVILSFGVAGAAYADPGGGNGNDGSSPSNGNAYGADSGNGSDNANAYGADNGSGAASDADANGAAAVAAVASGSNSAKSGSSTRSSSDKGSAAGSSSGKSAGTHKTIGTAGTSGAVTQPQPISGADDNTGGANGQCAPTRAVYCSTRNGSPSGNGNGGGKAVGKPCAGCVGKADNKNPQGQMPGPQDANNGYECDGNKGIAKTNPAHTGCKPGTPPCVGAGCNPPPPPVCVGAGCNPQPPGTQCPPGTVLVNGVCVAGQEEVLCPDGSPVPQSGVCPTEEEVTPPTVLGEEAFRPQPNAQVQGAQAGVLPATGSSSGIGLLAGVGFAMLALGAGVLMRRRTD